MINLFYSDIAKLHWFLTDGKWLVMIISFDELVHGNFCHNRMTIYTVKWFYYLVYYYIYFNINNAYSN